MTADIHTQHGQPSSPEAAERAERHWDHAIREGFACGCTRYHWLPVPHLHWQTYVWFRCPVCGQLTRAEDVICHCPNCREQN